MVLKESEKKGFTLIELLLVIAIIGIVMLLAVTTYSSINQRMRLDISANTLKTAILEARDKTKAGFQVDEEEGLVACFGMRLKYGENPIPLLTPFSGGECSTSSNDIVELPYITSENDNIGVIEATLGDLNVVDENSEFEFFFTPPSADLTFDREFPKDPFLNISVGYLGEGQEDQKRIVSLDLVTKTISLYKPEDFEEQQEL